ncbi:MAG TPA: protease inhibitor I9 family protein [Nitrososphaeraceae archaeon]|nr:protease inhibitor I9 family protein [Nitrososphaeraceae archaeon]
MSPQYDFRIYFLIALIPFFSLFLAFTLSENVNAIVDLSSNRTFSHLSFQNIALNNIENNIPNQFIVYFKNEINQQNKPLDPLDFFNSELKDKGCELLQVYNHVAKGFAIKVPDEKIIEELKQNPLIEYIGQDKRISANENSSPDSQMTIEVMSERDDNKK